MSDAVVSRIKRVYIFFRDIDDVDGDTGSTGDRTAGDGTPAGGDITTAG